MHPLFSKARNTGHRVRLRLWELLQRHPTTVHSHAYSSLCKEAPSRRKRVSRLPYWAPLLPLLGRFSACKRSEGRPGVMAAAAKASRRCTCRGLRAA